MTTPKQMAKMLTKFSDRHPEIQFSRLIIAQVPGSMPRSSTVRGVVESFFTLEEVHCAQRRVQPDFCGMRGRGRMWARARAVSSRRATPGFSSSAATRSRRSIVKTAALTSCN